MTRSRRPLADALANWSERPLADLLRYRPDLVQPAPPDTIDDLASRAQRKKSLSACLEELDLAQHRMLQLLLCAPSDPTLAELAALLPDDVELEDIEPVLASLEALALVWRYRDRIYFPDTVKYTMASPGGLGPPLDELLQNESADALWIVLRNIHDSIDRAVPKIDVPPSAVAETGRPKAKVIRAELATLLARADVVEAVLADAPPGMADLTRALARGDETIELPLYGQLPRRYEPTMRPELWLVTRALLLPEHSYAVQPREVGIALLGGRPNVDLALEPPDPIDGEAPDVAAVDATAIERGAHTVRQVGDLCDWFEAEPMACLKDGGLGARSLKTVATRFDLTPMEAGRLVNIAYFSGLLEQARVEGKGRPPSFTRVARTTDGGRRWLELDPAAQWLHLAGSWLRSSTIPSVAGHRDSEDKVIPAMAHVHHGGARLQRALVLTAMARLPEGDASTAASLTGLVYWIQPHLFLRGPASPEMLVSFVCEEAEQLGMIAHGRLSTYGTLLLEGAEDEAAARVAADLPAEADGITIQADHTLVAVGTLARETALELRLLADEESKGVATSYRISATSIRRALDAGRSAESILAFLGHHATKGIPQPVEYLVNDIARRYGNIRVGAAASFVRCEDPALLADVLSHRRTRKLHLTQLAPTIAVSSLAPVKLLEGLREAGFFPAEHREAGADGEGDAAVIGADGVVEVAARPAADRRRTISPTEPLPEPFRHEDRPGAPGSLDPDSAAALARALLSRETVERSEEDPKIAALDSKRGESDAARWTSSEHPNALRNLMAKAMGSGHVHSFRLLGMDDPLRVYVESWVRGDLVVREVDGGQVLIVSPLDVVSVEDETPDQPVEPMRGVWDRPAR